MDFGRAVSADDFAAADEALRRGADVNALIRSPDGERENILMLMAASGPTPSKVEYLLSKNPDVNARSARGRTPLMYAAAKGRIENIKLLLAAGADPNAVDYQGDDVLSYAKRKQRVEAIALLEEAIKNRPR